MTLFTTAKIVVTAASPSASVSTATAVKPGFFNNMRRPNLRSWIKVLIVILGVERSATGFSALVAGLVS